MNIKRQTYKKIYCGKNPQYTNLLCLKYHIARIVEKNI
jgi:hypothetical protein